MTSGAHAGTSDARDGAAVALRWRWCLSALTLGCALVAVGCGGSSHKAAPSTGGPGLSDPDNQTLVKADLDLLGAARTTSRILSDPQGVRKALQLLRALTVTQTLGVAPDQTVGGQLASNLFDQLDGILPGALTTGTGSAERLNAPVVRRFQRYARTKPILVEEPTVKQAVGQLTRILSGRPANLRVTLAGQQPAVTARQDLARDAQTTRPYWPQLSAQLSQLATRLR